MKEWKNEMWYMQTIGFPLASKISILLCVMTWMNLENITLNKPITEGQILHGAIYMRYPKYSNSQIQKVE